MKKNKGVTIVELLIYIGLLTLFLTVLTSLFVSIFKLQLSTQSTSGLTQDTRYIISRMGHDIENAASLTVSDTTHLHFNGTNTYHLDGEGNLILTIGGIGNKINGLDTSISDLSFQKVGDTVQVKFIINSNIIEESGPRSQAIQTTYGIR